MQKRTRCFVIGGRERKQDERKTGKKRSNKRKKDSNERNGIRIEQRKDRM